MSEQQRKILIQRVLILVTVLVGLYILFTYSLMNISGGDSTKLSRVFVTQNGEASLKTKLTPGESKTVIIKRGTNLMTLRSETGETRAPVRFTPIWSGSYNVTIKPEVEIEKIGSNTLNCGAESKSKIFYSYRCSGNSDIIKYSVESNFPASSVAVERSSVNPLTPKQYQSGILTLTQKFPDDPYSISYITLQDSPTRQVVTVPKTVGLDNADEADVITNQTSSSDEHFLLLDRAKKRLHIFTRLNDTAPQSVDLQAKEKEQSLFTHNCSLGSEFIACIYGQTESAVDGEVNKEKVQGLGNNSVLSLYSLKGDRLARRVLKEDGVVTSIAVSKDVVAGHTSNNAMVLYQYNEGGFKRIGSSRGVEGVFPSQNLGILVQEGSSLYSTNLETLQTNLLMRSTNVRISDFASARGGGLFTAFINNQADAKLSTFKITNTPHTGKRIEDLLPTSRDSLIRELDYVNGVLYVRVNLTSYSSDRLTGEFSVDEAEYSATRNEVLRQLTKSGIDKKFSKIVFSY